jgi:GntR family transcriptional regulator
MWISIDENDNRPMYLQIINQIKEQVSKGALQPGDNLPSVRELAESLKINMHTVRSAYLKLREQGVITIRLGRGARIAALQPYPASTGAITDLKVRIKELATDAFLMGLSRDDLRVLIDRQLDDLKES